MNSSVGALPLNK